MAEQKEGKCPKCGTDLEYDGGEVADDSYLYEVGCPACEWVGSEAYDLVFSALYEAEAGAPAE